MFHIEGRRWFQRSYGNTYHSVRIFRDGTEIMYIPFTYGYGDQFIETALEALEEKGEIPPREQLYNGAKEGGSYYLRETLGASYSVIDVDRKGDL